MRNELKLEVAHNPICLRLSDPHVFDPLVASYRSFLSDKQPKVVIDVQILDENPPRVPPGGLVVSKEGFTISYASFSGTIDFGRGRGSLSATAEWLAAALRTFLRNVFIFLLLEKGGLLLHALGVLKEGEVYVFFGPSGAGKTTAAGLSEGHTVLSDDLLFLQPEDESYIVHPTPSWGHMQKGEWQNRPYLVKAAFKLVKSERIEVREYEIPHAISDVITSPPTFTFMGADILLTRFSDLVRRVPFYELHFLKDRSFWPWIDANLRKIGIKNANKNTKRGLKHGKQKAH